MVFMLSHIVTKPTGLLFFLFLFPLLLSFNSEGHLKFADGLEIQVAQKSWCVAKNTANDSELIYDIVYACEVLPDCNLIQPSGSCFIPDTPLNHASVVMNQYYALKGRNTWNCYFFGFGFGLITVTDPSYGSGKYAL